MSEEITGGRVEEASTKKMASYGVTFYLEAMFMYSYNILIFYFYEVVIGLPVLLVGLSFAIYAIWNMINDPLAGYLTDKPMKWADKWGVRKPWVIVGALGTIIFWFLLLSPPNLNVKSDPWPMFWYMIIITCILDAFFSIYTTHKQGGFVNQFRTQNERRKASVISRLVNAVGPLTAAVILVPMIIDYENRSSFMVYGLATAIIMVICVILFYPGLKESPELIARYREGYEERAKLDFWKVLKGAFKSKYFKLQLFAFTMYSVGISLWMANLIYYLKDVLEVDIASLGLFILVYMIALYCSIPVWSKLAKKVGPIKLTRYGLLAMGLAVISFLFVTSIVTMTIAMVICGICFSSFLSMYMVMMADSFDSVTVDLGCHQEATIQGITMFFVRVAFLVIGAIFTIVHIATGYNPDPNATQTPLAVLGVRLIGSVIAGAFPIAGGIALILWYDLYGDKRAAMKAKLKECGL